MDLGINGRRAIVCGSSSGLGYACAEALGAAGVDILLNGRTEVNLANACAKLSDRLGRTIEGVAADVTTASGRDRLLAAMPDPDILVNNAAGPPPGTIEDWDEEDWHSALHANMVAPILLIRSILPAMRARGWGRILNITSAAVKAPLPLLGLSNGARSGLTGFIAGLAREGAAQGVTINNLLPGYFATDRLTGYVNAMASSRNVEPHGIWQEMAAKSPARRVGQPVEFGAACAFLASEHAGFIHGQNILLDGGAYPGTL
ncbi:MAG: SDR family oxidoreductase [Sphingobium sp.]